MIVKLYWAYKEFTIWFHESNSKPLALNSVIIKISSLQSERITGGGSYKSAIKRENHMEKPILKYILAVEARPMDVKDKIAPFGF